MDTEHWFAPMYDTYTVLNPAYDNTKNGDYLYVSTDTTDEFEVTVYSGNVVIDKIAVRKGSPKYVQIPPGIVTTTNPSDTFLSSDRGLHLVGSRKFFANLRILRGPHAEIINSKGFAGLGKVFYAGMAPINDSSPTFNSQICIIATENNTNVNISGYNQNIAFINNNPFQTELNIKLNKGQSYIMATRCDTSEDPVENEYGLIGAKIESDKPISLSNGNFTASYISGAKTSDILMDQSVPVERIGKNHVLSKGNGNIIYGMEMALVVATKNNTDIIINGNYVRTINEGDKEWVNGAIYYVNQGNNVYNMSIQTSEDVYVYQFLAGDDNFSNGRASGGMNLIPSLDCFLPNQIVELPAINEIGLINSFKTKINIISEFGAKVNINGEFLAPYPIPGNSDWQLFTKEGVTGNVSVYSDKAVTAGIASGNGAVGFGGYFAGFSSKPAISKTGDCAKGQRLEVDEGYDFYKWEHNGLLLDSGPNLSSINPLSYYPSDPGKAKGNYVCIITKTGCKTQSTNVFTYLNCPKITTNSDITTGNCKSTDAILVQFSTDPTKIVKLGSVVVTKQPEAGSVSAPFVDPITNKIYIKYNPDNTNLSKVTFTYYFEDTDFFPDREEVTVTINIAQIKLQNQEGTECLGYDGKGIYDLREIFEIPVNNDPTYSLYEYYQDKTLTKKIPEVDVSNQYNEVKSYKSMPGQIVYVKVTNIYGCNNQTLPAEIVLKTFELPTINTIEVEETNSVKIDVSKGKPGYYFYIKKNGKETDFIPDSAYTYFDKVPATIPIYDGKGKYMVYVKSADNCLPVTQNFSVIGISNIITPNDDGANDFIDYSDLMTKLNPRFEIYDRNGKAIFKGSPENHYIWNGKSSGKELPTSSYWYLLEWNESSISKRTQKSGWILLKNRN